MERRIPLSKNEGTTRIVNGNQHHRSNGNVGHSKGPRKIMDPRDAKKTVKRIADPRDIKEAKSGPRRIAMNGNPTQTNRRASVQHVAPSNGRIITAAPQEKTRARRQSAPARTTPLSLDDLISDGWEPSQDDLIRLQRLTTQKTDKNNSQNLRFHDNNNRRVSCIPPVNELELSTLQEEDESD